MQQRRRGTAIGLAALVAIALAACSPVETAAPATGTPVAGSAGPPPTARPTPVPRASGPVARGITPTSQRMVVRAEAFSDVGGAWGPGVFVYDDGSIVDARGGPLTVRALAPEGLAWITSQMRESGLFTTSRVIPFAPVPHGFMTFRLTFVDGDGAVTVTATNVGRDGESRQLVELAEGILAPAAWVPPDGWLDGDSRRYPYIARETRITSEVRALGSDAWINAAQTVDRVTWPLDASPLEVGEPVDIEGAPDRALRCAIITGTDEALVRSSLALVEGGAEEGPLVATWYLWTPGPGLLGLALRPFLPHETAACAPGDMPAAPSLAAAPRPSLAALLVAGQDSWAPIGEPRLIVVAHDNTGEGEELREGRVSYYADGTVLFFEPPPPAVGIGARRLSAAGLQALNDNITRSGLVEVSYSERIPDGVEVDVMYNVLMGDVILNASDRGVDARATEIASLAERLLDPVAWLPATAWIEDPATVLQYRPPAVEIMIRPENHEESTFLPRVEVLDWPLGGSVATFGQPDPDYPGLDVRSATLTTTQAIEVVRALRAIGARGAGSVSRVEYWLATSEPGTKLVIEMIIPMGERGL